MCEVSEPPHFTVTVPCLREGVVAVDVGARVPNGSISLCLWVQLSEVPAPVFGKAGFSSAGLRARGLRHEVTHM